MTAQIGTGGNYEGHPESPSLSVEIAERGPTVVLALIGEARVWDSDVLKAAVSRVLLTSARRIVVDLSACTLLSSIAVARLIEMSQIARRAGGSVMLAAPRPCVLQVIQILRLEQIFPVHETVDAALDALERRACA